MPDSATAKQTDLKQRILREAAAMVRAEGVAALSMRKLSKAVGASTMVLYTYFANKHDLLNQLYLEGYDHLRRKLEAVEPCENPIHHVMNLGRAYRRAALDNPGAYDLMQGSSLQGVNLTPESLRAGRESFKVLAEAVAVCMQAQLVAQSDPKAMAHVLWGAIHGPISLQLAGHFESDEEAEQSFETTLNILKAGLLQRQPADH